MNLDSRPLTWSAMYGQPVELTIAADAGAEHTSRVVVVPANEDGVAKCSHGDYHLTSEDAARVIAAFESQGVDLPIDYEHASAPGVMPPGTPNPAAGWITKLVHEVGVGLIAMVKWTDRAREYIRNKEYRYLSPAVYLDKKTRHVLSLVSAGLVHNPAMVGMEPLTASNRKGSDMGETKATGPIALLLAQEDGSPEAASAEMLVGRLQAALEDKGKDPGSTLESVLAAALAFVKGDAEAEGGGEGGGEGGEVAAAARTALGLPGDADATLVAAKIKELNVHLGHTPNKEVAAMKSRLDVLDAAEADRAARMLVAKYDSKINPNSPGQREAALSMAKRDPGEFEKLFATLPDAIPPQGTTTAPKGVDGGRAGVIATAKAVFKGEPQLAKLNDAETWINGALSEMKLAPLTTEELATV